MQLNDLVRGAIGIVNPNITGSLYRSKPYALQGTRQVPQYEEPIEITLQVQSISDNELRHLDNISQQGEKKIVYASDQLYGLDRVRGTGGDILEFYGRRWLVVQRLEGWEAGGWCKVLVTSQLDEPQDDEAELEDYVGNSNG